MRGIFSTIQLWWKYSVSVTLACNLLLLQILSQDAICLKATKQNVCMALREMQRRKCSNFVSAGTLRSRGCVQWGNPCSLPCITSEAVFCWLSHTASSQRALQKDISKYHMNYTKLSTNIILSVILQLNSREILLWRLTSKKKHEKERQYGNLKKQQLNPLYLLDGMQKPTAPH